MLDLSQFKNLIVAPVLAITGLGGPVAINLVAGTALVESGLKYLKQIDGSANGLFQIENATHLSIQNYLNRPLNAKLKERILSAAYVMTVLSDEGLIFNLRYAALMCRLKYHMSPQFLPDNTAEGLANYHKIIYNTSLGKADVEKNIPLFQEVIDTPSA